MARRQQKIHVHGGPAGGAGRETEGGTCLPSTASHSGNAFTEHIFEYRALESRKLVWALAMNLLGMIVEVAGGLLTGSISLLTDAGHMFTDSFALLISMGAIWIAKKPPCHHRTYGLFRAEILAAFVNSLFLFAASAGFIIESVRRLLSPKVIDGRTMLAVGVFGLLVNLFSMFFLMGHRREDLNLRGAFLHMMADTVSSVAVTGGAAIIIFTGRTWIDPVIGIGISSAIFLWAWGLFRESSRILLEMTPRGMDVDGIAAELRRVFPEIKDLHNVHLWAITGEMYVFTAHLRLREESLGGTTGRQVLARVNRYLKERYPIVESTIQWLH